MLKEICPIFLTDVIGDSNNIGTNNGNYVVKECVLFDPKTKELALWSHVVSDFDEPEIISVMRHSSLRHVHMLCKKLARKQYELFGY